MFASNATPKSIADAIEAIELQPNSKKQKRDLVPTAAKSTRGTRLPENWQPSETCVAYALDRRMSRERVATEAEKFVNYWTAKTGANTTKKNWEGTWRNWILTAMEQRYGYRNNFGKRSGTHSAAGPQPTGADAIIAGMGRIASRNLKRRNAAGPDNQKMEAGADAPAELDFGAGRTR